jgi:hypothetical protein
MQQPLAHDVEPPVVGHAQAPAGDRGMQILEYAVAALALLAAVMLAFVR